MSDDCKQAEAREPEAIDWENLGIIEMAIRNPRVSDWVSEMECRLWKAERGRDAALERIAALEALLRDIQQRKYSCPDATTRERAITTFITAELVKIVEGAALSGKG